MRLFELLLHLYPAAFRIEYGDELRQVFAHRRAETSGIFGLTWMWMEVIKDTFLNAFAVHWDILGQDLRYAARTLGRSRGFALTAILVTGLGVGANTAVFSITDHVLIRPLPFADSERLVKLWEHPPGYARMELSPPNYRDWRDRSVSFEEMGAYHSLSANLVGIGDPQRLAGVSVTAEVFSVLGTRPFIGRVLDMDDDMEGAARTVILSHSLWQREFGAEGAVLGRSVRLDDSSYEVIGVMPPEFLFPRRDTQFWIPKQLGPQDNNRDNNYLQGIARLKPDVSLEEARGEMDLIAAQLEDEYPAENAETGATVRRLREEYSEQTRLLWPLWSSFGKAFSWPPWAAPSASASLMSRANRWKLCLRAFGPEIQPRS